jgi:hypothetical protein
MSRPTDELLHWSMVRMYWAGDDTYQLELSTIFESYPTNWLIDNLADRLASELGTPVAVEVRPAIPIGPGEGTGFDEFGLIAISGLREPLPPINKLKQVVSDAVADAHDAADAAENVIRAYVTQLRMPAEEAA